MWRPHLFEDIVLLESVQHRASKFILNNYTSDYNARLKALNLLPLMMVYEINDLVFFLNHFDFLNLLISLTVTFCTTSTRSSSGLKLQHVHSSSNTSRYFYFACLPHLWNSLSPFDPNLSLPSLISILKRFFWEYFPSHFNSSNPCSFHFSCPCSRCLSHSSLPNFSPG